MEHTEIFDFVDSAFLDMWSTPIVVGRELLIKRHLYTGK